MNQFGYPESDWKLYKSKVGDWQEGYMEKLCKEYIALLSSDKLPSDRFWELEKRIREDMRAIGVVVILAILAIVVKEIRAKKKTE